MGGGGWGVGDEGYAKLQIFLTKFFPGENFAIDPVL